jgi:hypothetical protein
MISFKEFFNDKNKNTTRKEQKDLSLLAYTSLTPFSELIHFILNADFEDIRQKQGLVTSSSTSLAHDTAAGTTRLSLELDLARHWRLQLQANPSQPRR